MATSIRAPTADSRSNRLVKLALIVLIVVALNLLGTWLVQQFSFQLFPRHEPILHAIVLGTAILYVLLMATPYMPGIELGLALLLMLGNKGAILVYLCTVVALVISFAVGRNLPPHLLYRFLDWLHLQRAAALVRQLEPLNQEQRLALLNDKAPARVAPFLLKHRYLAIAAILNLPGNALIGGGGGIGLVVGMSKIVPWPTYVVLVAIAVAPVPLWFFLQGV